MHDKTFVRGSQRDDCQRKVCLRQLEECLSESVREKSVFGDQRDAHRQSESSLSYGQRQSKKSLSQLVGEIILR